MQCQYSGCTNIGVHSCSSCGKLVCGMHAHIFTYFVRCEACDLPIRQAAAKKKAEEERAASKGCSIALIGLTISALGIILTFVVAGGVGDIALFGLLFLLGGLITIATGTVISGVFNDLL